MKADWTLALRYERTVRGMARRRVAGLPSEALVEAEELVSVGLIAVAVTARHYNPTLGPLGPFVEDRIQWAFTDYLRTIDPRGRPQRSLIRQLQIARDTGNRAEIARLEKELAPVLVRVMISLDERPPDERQLSELIPDPSTPDLDEGLFLSEQAANVHAALARLPERERFVLTLYYFEDLNLREIGEMMDVSESRACQLKTRGESRVRFWLTSPLARVAA